VAPARGLPESRPRAAGRSPPARLNRHAPVVSSHGSRPLLLREHAPAPTACPDTPPPHSGRTRTTSYASGPATDGCGVELPSRHRPQAPPSAWTLPSACSGTTPPDATVPRRLAASRSVPAAPPRRAPKPAVRGIKVGLRRAPAAPERGGRSPSMRTVGRRALRGHHQLRHGERLETLVH
jgi:hypothetical protein